jgi:hypothetical protein
VAFPADQVVGCPTGRAVAYLVALAELAQLKA